MNNYYNLEITNYCEIDRNASKAYSKIHNVPESINYGDVTKIDCSKLPYRNIMAKDTVEENGSECTVALVGGSPCQSFSTAGKLEGSQWTCESCGKSFDPLEIENLEESACPYCGADTIKKTESSLIAYWLKIFKEVRPQFAVFENVANILSKRFEGYCSPKYWQNACMARPRWLILFFASSDNCAKLSV